MRKASGVCVLVALMLMSGTLSYGQDPTVDHNINNVRVTSNPNPPEIGQEITIDWTFGRGSTNKAAVFLTTAASVHPRDLRVWRPGAAITGWTALNEGVQANTCTVRLTAAMLGTAAPTSGNPVTVQIWVIELKNTDPPALEIGERQQVSLQIRAANEPPVITNLRVNGQSVAGPDLLALVGGSTPDPQVSADLNDPENDQPIVCSVEIVSTTAASGWVNPNGSGALPMSFRTGQVDRDTTTRFRLVARDSRGATSYAEFSLKLTPAPAPNPPPTPPARPDPAPNPPAQPPTVSNTGPTDLEIAALSTSVVSGQPLDIRFLVSDPDAADVHSASLQELRASGPPADIACVPSSASNVVTTTALVNNGTNPLSVRLRVTVKDKAGASVSGVITVTVLPVPPPTPNPPAQPPVVAQNPPAPPPPPAAPQPLRVGQRVETESPGSLHGRIRESGVNPDDFPNRRFVRGPDGVLRTESVRKGSNAGGNKK